jgi:5,10-methylenetetrahydrofolate reductase
VTANGRMDDRPQGAPTVAEVPSRLAADLSREAFPVSVEIRPAMGVNPGAMLQQASLIKLAGAGYANIADPPVGRSRMASVLGAVLVQQQVGLEVTAHVAGRDRCLSDIQADLVDAHALGLRNVLCVRGAPRLTWAHGGARPGPGVGSLDLIRLLGDLNRGQDASGSQIGPPTSFFVGAAADPNAASPAAEVRTLRRKLAGGVQFLVTRPVFSLDLLEAFLERAEASVPVLMGVLPLTSLAHAEYLIHERGLAVPAPVRRRLADAGADSTRVGLEMAVELVDAARRHVQGVCVLPPQQRCDLASDLAARIRRLVGVANSCSVRGL